jgi:hypothetical protein
MGTSGEATLGHAEVTACYAVFAVCALSQKFTGAWLCDFPRYPCLHRGEW